MKKYKTFNDFKVLEVLSEHNDFVVYDLEYDKDGGLNALEAFAEGSFKIGRLRVERKYIASGSFEEDMIKGLGNKYTHYTRVTNTDNQDSPIAQIGFVHGFSECSDTWLETAY